MMTIADERTLAALKQVKDLQESGQLACDREFRMFGICRAMAHFEPANFNHIELQNLFIMWPEYSGNLDYPVPVPSFDPENNACDFYMKALNCWEGEYGAARIRLLNFCIATLEARLAA